jgi:hypothetical protein
VKGPVYFFKVLSIDVGVHLRRRDIGVAEHFLHSAQVCPTLEKMCSEGMPERVRVNLLLDSCRYAKLVDNLPDRHATEFFPSRIQEENIICLSAL